MGFPPPRRRAVETIRTMSDFTEDFTIRGEHFSIMYKKEGDDSWFAELYDDNHTIIASGRFSDPESAGNELKRRAIEIMYGS